jgi:RHS repeat-associated protein
VAGTLSGVPWSRETVYEDVARKQTEKDAKNQPTVHELDGLNRVTKTTDPAGKTVVTTYDGVNKVSERDKRGNTTRFAYDVLNRVTRTTDPTPFDAQTVEVTYDDARNRKIEKDRRGIQTVTQTDPLGRVVTVTDAATVNVSTGAVTGIVLETHVYDGNGNKTSTKDAEGKETRFTYDAANRVASRIDGYGTPEVATLTYAYDKNGNPTEEKDQRAADLGEPFSMQKTYDELNRLRTVKNGEAEVTTYAYDDEGNKTQVKDSKDQPTDYAYDELGKLIRVTQAAPAPGDPRPITSYTHDKNRNRIRQTDANTHVVEMEYDPLNRLTLLTQDPGGFSYVTRHDYDENGNETKLTDPKGQTVTTTYDELNRQKTKTYAFAPSDPVRPWRHTTGIVYTYDKSSNLTQVDESVASGTDPPETKTTLRTYDDLDRLASEATPLPDGGTRTVAYTYFGNGTRKTVTDAEGLVTQYTYDGQNRTKTTTTAFGRPEAATTTYTYWPDDLLKTVQTPNGIGATHGYDKADRLTALTNAKGGATVSRYAYTYDQNGNRLSQVEENGGTTETTTYTYDGLDRLTTVTYPTDANYLNGRVVSYGYDAVGNRARETERTTAGAILADKQGVFDNTNRLTSLADLVTPANSTTFTWDPNGNQLSKTVGTGLPTEYRYDIRDKLVETVQGPATLGRFQYDFHGRRNQKIGDDGVKQYVYDQTSVLAEYDAAGIQKAKYDYGSDRLISLFRTDEGRRYFQLDGLRSVVNLTDDAGSVAASYHLTAFGEYRFPTELSPSKNRFGFTGYEWDSETGLYNAKARYFDPKLGRFLTQDSYFGQIDEPPSLHRYFYANDNPLKYIDLTGHAGFKATGVDTTTITVDQRGTVYVGGVTATESVTVTASVDRVRAIGTGVSQATAFPARLANDAGFFVTNVVTAGGAGGIRRAVQEGRASPGDLGSLATAYNQGNASFLTVGGVDAYVNAYAGEGRSVAGSAVRAGGGVVVNALPIDEARTLADSEASGYDKLAAVGTAALKVAAIRGAARGAATMVEEGRTAAAKAVPAQGKVAARPPADYEGFGGEFLDEGLRMTDQPFQPAPLRGARNPKVAEALRKGQQAHTERQYPSGFKKEVELPSGKKMDAYNAQTREIRELKPDNPRAIRRGKKQVKEYCDECDKAFGPGHTVKVETYDPKQIQ